MVKRVNIPEPPENLSLTEEVACFIVLKAREYDAKIAPSAADSGSNPIDDAVSAILGDTEGDQTWRELYDAIDGLNSDQQHELVALTWIGRGDFTAADWSAAVDLARDRDNGRIAEYLVGLSRLPDLLEEGLEQIGLSCTAEDIEHSGAPRPGDGPSIPD